MKYIPASKIFYNQNKLKEMITKNPFGDTCPPDNWPRGDDAIWEADTVRKMKSAYYGWKKWEEENRLHLIICPYCNIEFMTRDKYCPQCKNLTV